MRTSRVIAALIALVMGLVAGDQTYQLVWSDEFNGNSLDESKWGYQNICDGAGNNELECYTSRTQNVAVNNGTLVITPLIENYGGRQYTSGRISTSGKYYWKYGRFEARAKLPDGLYLWPAIWMMPQNSVYGGWAASGEIDIMENHGGQNNEHSSTLHYGGSWPKNTYDSSNSRYESFDLTRDFHVYSATWTPQSISFAIDGNTYYTISLQKSFNNAAAGSYPYANNGSPFDQEFHWIINLAIGGGFFGSNSQSLTPDIARGWRSPQFQVDYVRVYQLKDGVINNPTPAPTISTGDCQAMFNGLTCRTSTNDVSQLSYAAISSSRDWLCNNYGQYCDAITGGKYTGCNAAEQLSYAMNLYYQDYKSQQGDGACDFGGLGATYTTQAAQSTSSTQAAPATTSSQATPTPSTSSSSSDNCCCTEMWNGLTCRPATEDADSAEVASTRSWLCSNYPQYCTAINDGGDYSSCSVTQQVAYAMNLYYQDYSSQQGSGACDFGGLGQVITPATTCPTGQSVCDDARFGQTCYVVGGPYDCTTGDDNKKHLCPKGTSSCGSAACYLESQYTCTNGLLARNT